MSVAVDQDAAKDVGSMPAGGFNAPSSGGLSAHKGDTALIGGCRVGGKDRVALATAGMNGSSRRNAHLSKDSNIDILDSEVAYGRLKAAVPRV